MKEFKEEDEEKKLNKTKADEISNHSEEGECRICFSSTIGLEGNEPDNLRSQELTRLL